MFGNLRILGGWQELRNSPILTEFRWSGLVLSAFEKNRHLFFASDDRDLPVRIPSYPHYPPHSQSAPIPGLLAMHIRRGDFEHHCGHFAMYGSRFNGFASFPELPDKFVVPEGQVTPELKAQYARACYPTVGQIVEKVREVRATSVGAGLDRVYVMTNANATWVAELKRALSREAKWVGFATKRELVLTDEQRYVAQALDMMIGQRAQVVIGNGVSVHADGVL